MLPRDFIPQKPFMEFKWKWACLQCTEGINDPVVLLGVLSRMRKLESSGKNYKYSSQEFAQELIDLDNDLKGSSVGVDLARRTGERNLIRNSGQYWKAVGLIPSGSTGGHIQLTEFGRKVADHEISQTEFSAITIQTFKLPNSTIQNARECSLWDSHSLVLYPLRIILGTMLALGRFDLREEYLTVDELIKIVIPLSGYHAEIQDYANFVFWYRYGELDISNWPNCCPEANDKRIAREYMLFLANYGYLNIERTHENSNLTERYALNTTISDEINEILAKPITDETLQQALSDIRSTNIVSEVARKTINSAQYRPKQTQFRHDVLLKCQRCIITNVEMPEVLEAAHIKPHKYNGPEEVENGFAMRTDIHILFDTGNLRISVDGLVELSDIARNNYGWTIPPKIVIPDYVNKSYLQWRWDNYVGI